MFSVVANKLVQQYKLILERKRCLRSRLRGFSCGKCVAACIHQAITDSNGEICHDQSKCGGCGNCVAACPNDAFSFERLDLHEIIEESLPVPNLIVSCHRCKFTTENEVRVPCVGIITEEVLVTLGLKRQYDTTFNLTECATCQNHLSATLFAGRLRHLHKKVGHLFRARIVTVRSVDDLPEPKQSDRRKFLFSLGNSAADIVISQLGTTVNQTKKRENNRRIPERVQWRLRLLQGQIALSEELANYCSPTIRVSDDCTLCPRCTGMCPTGALRVRKEKSEKALSSNQHLCSGCGLCVDFCKVRALSIRDAIVSFPIW